MARRGRVIPFPNSPVEVYRCDQPEAMVVKSLFESEGIPTLLRSRLAHSVHPFTVGAQGEVVILVPTADVARAAALISASRRSPPRARA
jgi:hypothetical protein